MAVIAIVTLLVAAAAAYGYGYRTAQAPAGNFPYQRWRALPQHYGLYSAVAITLPALLILALWPLLEFPLLQWLLSREYGDVGNENQFFFAEVQQVAAGDAEAQTPQIKQLASSYSHWQDKLRMLVFITLLICITAGIRHTIHRLKPSFPARAQLEKLARFGLFTCAMVSIMVTLLIVASVLFESFLFFEKVSIDEFLLGLTWSPQSAMHEGQATGTVAFGAVPLFTGTLLITLIAMFVAVPIGLYSAIYMSEYANPRLRAYAKPMLEILAGIPTVVYGYFALVTVAPFIRDIGQSVGLNVSAESALAAGLVMGVMIIPFVSSLSDDIIAAVPRALRDASYGLGATQSETIRKVVLPAALPGIMGAVLLAISRAIGETMIVVMAVGLAANLTFNPLESVTTVTVQIVSLLVGDQEFDSAKTLAAFALGLALFVVTLIFNVIALMIVKKYREAYE